MATRDIEPGEEIFYSYGSDKPFEHIRKQLQAQAAQAKKEEAAREEELLRQQQEEKAARKGKLVLGKSRSVTPPQQKGHGVSASHSVPVLPH